MNIKLLLASFGALTATLACGSTAFAQDTGVTRPYRGLFGVDTNAWTETLSVSGSASVGYDTSALSHGADGAPAAANRPTPSRARTYNYFSGGLSYTFGVDRAQMGASVSSGVRYYPGLSAFVPSSHGASAAGTFALTRSTSVGVSQSVAFQPAMLFQPFATLVDQPLGQVTAPDYDFAAARAQYRSYGTGASINQALWRSAQLSLSYGRQTATFSESDARFESQTGAVRVTQRVARGIGIRAGYGYGESRYSGEGSPLYRSHTIDAGIDYNRPVSLSRRTRLALSTGTAAVDRGPITRYQITGNARLIRDIGRTWQAVASYGRNVGFYESLRAPYFYDSATVGLHGQIGRRVSFQSSAGVLLADFPYLDDEAESDFDTWQAGSSLGIAVTRNLALSLDYVFYRSRFAAPMFVGSDVTPLFDRHSVRLSLRAWAPLLQRGRRDGATR
jgi:hypothetical protein